MSRPDIQHVIVTGGTGYIGSALIRRLRSLGIPVTALGHRPIVGVRNLVWTLGEPLPSDAVRSDVPVSLQAIIHLSHDWLNSQDAEDRVNQSGTATLLYSCRNAGLRRFVFASSQSARQDADNQYGRIKYNIEQLLSGRREVAARIGLVYGGQRRSQYALLTKLVRLPLLPMVDPKRIVQPIHVNEVCAGLIALMQGAMIKNQNWYGLAHPHGMSFGHFLKLLASRLYGKKLRILPVPARLALLGADMIGMFPRAPNVRERVLGLVGTRPMDCDAHLKALDLSIAEVGVTLSREPFARKALLREARSILSPVSGKPSQHTMRQYARAINRTSDAGPAILPLHIRVMPSIARIFEPRAGILGERYRVAATLTEGILWAKSSKATGNHAL